MLLNNLVNTANKAKAKAKIQKNTQLGQQYFKRKRLLKMNLNSKDDQTDKKTP